MASPREIPFETWAAPATEVFRFWISFFPTAPLFGVEWRYGDMTGGVDSPAENSVKTRDKSPAKPKPAAKSKPAAKVAPKVVEEKPATDKAAKPVVATKPAAKTAPEKVAVPKAAPGTTPKAAPKSMAKAPPKTKPESATASAAKAEVKPVAEKVADAKPAPAKSAPAEPVVEKATLEKAAPVEAAAAKPVEPSTAPDDLKMIKGVGPGLEKQLNGLGIYQFAQIAKMSDKDLQSVDVRLTSFKGRCFRDDWVGQAKTLMG